MSTEPRIAPPPLPSDIKDFKSLRMWHWREFLAHREEELKFESYKDTAPAPAYLLTYQRISTMARAQARVHLGAVQVLNDLLPGTAEQDCAAEDAIKSAST